MKNIAKSLLLFIQIQLLTGLLLGPILACYFPLNITFWVVLLSTGTLVLFILLFLRALRGGVLGAIETMDTQSGFAEVSTDTAF